MHTSPDQSSGARRRPLTSWQTMTATPVVRHRPAAECSAPERAGGPEAGSPPIYGREEEFGELADSFQRAASGAQVFFLLSGRAGIGKTALVRTLRGVVGERGGRMVEGCFDRDRRHSPYNGLAEAVADLVAQIDTGPRPLRDLWRTRLIDGLGAHCGLLCEIAPTLRQLLGPAPSLVELQWPAAGQQVELAFRRLVSLLATREHPLLLFLDDIHWADEASLHLLQVLMESCTHACLMVVATCREEALEPGAAVPQLLAMLRRDSAMIVRRGLGPLPPMAIGNIIRDGIGRLNQHEALARLFFRLSGGNPTVVRQLLRDGCALGWLHLAPGARGCDWHAGPAPSDTAFSQLLTPPEQRLARLPVETRNALEVAALVGRRFDPAVIAEVLGWTPAQVTAALVPATVDEIVRLGNDGALHQQGRFCSDELVQIACRGVAEDRVAPLQLAIGQACWHAIAPENLDEHIFDVADQVNKGLERADDATMRIAIASLNLAAGLRANRIAAYRSASHYLGIGISLLPADSWAEQRNLSLALLMAQAEALIALGDAAALGTNLDALSNNARTPIEHLRIRTLEATHHHMAGRFAEALRCGLEGLADAGLGLPDSKDEAAIAAAFQAERRQLDSLLAGRSIGVTFASLAAADDSFGERLESLVARIAEVGTMVNAPVIDLVAILAARRSVARGCTRHTPLICSLLARALISRNSGYAEARELALAAMRLSARIGADPWAQARLLVHQFGFVLPWSRHIDNNLPQIEDALLMTTHAQDPLHGAELQALSAITQFFLGRRLDAVTTLHQRTASHGHTRLAGIIPSMTQPFAGAAAALRGETGSLTEIDCEEFDAHAYTCRFKNTPFMLTLLASARMPLHVLAGEPARALELLAAPEMRAVPPFLAIAAVQFWRGMACAIQAETADSDTRAACLTGLAEATDFLAEVECGDGGENVTHRLLCLLGEQTRIQGDQALAFEFLCDAVEFADRNGYTLESGFIHERMALLLTQGNASPREIAATLAKAADRFRECQAVPLHRRVRSRLHALPREALVDASRADARHAGILALATGDTPSRLPGALAGARALIVDDESAQRKLITQVLAGYLPRVDTARSAQEALMRIGEAVAADTPFTLIVVSSALLQEIGAAFVRQVRRTHRELMPPLFLLLSDTASASADAHLMVGFDAAITKPVDTLALFETLRQLFSDETALGLRRQRRPRTPELAGMRVLLCESDPTHRALALELLRRAGMYADTAADGHGAVEQLRRSGPDRYSVVLMAFDLPGVDGLSATRMLRADHRFDALPIIAMNSEPIQRTRALCLRAGMNDQLPRPLDADRLYDTLSLWTQPGALDRHETGERADLDLARKIAPRGSATHVSPRAEIAQLRRATADTTPAASENLQRMQGNARLYLRLLGRLRAVLHSPPDAVRAALARTDIPGPAAHAPAPADPVPQILSQALRLFRRALVRLAPGGQEPPRREPVKKSS